MFEALLDDLTKPVKETVDLHELMQKLGDAMREKGYEALPDDLTKPIKETIDLNALLAVIDNPVF